MAALLLLDAAASFSSDIPQGCFTNLKIFQTNSDERKQQWWRVFCAFWLTNLVQDRNKPRWLMNSPFLCRILYYPWEEWLSLAPRKRKRTQWWGVKDATRGKWSNCIFGHIEAFIFETRLWLPYVLPCCVFFLSSSSWSLLIRRSGLLSLEKNEGEDDDDDGVETTALCLPLSISSAISSRAIKCCSLITFFLVCASSICPRRPSTLKNGNDFQYYGEMWALSTYIPLHSYNLLLLSTISRTVCSAGSDEWQWQR